MMHNTVLPLPKERLGSRVHSDTTAWSLVRLCGFGYEFEWTKVQILQITESMYFLECVTIATTTTVAIDYGILSIVSANLD